MKPKPFTILPYFQISAMGFICGFIIIIYGSIRCKKSDFKDPLTTTFAPPPFDKYLDGWGLTHFGFFLMLGYLFPRTNLLIFAFILGVCWEIIEFIFKDHPFYLSKCEYTLTTQDGSGWWYGRWQDIVVNTLGLLVGYMIARRRR